MASRSSSAPTYCDGHPRANSRICSSLVSVGIDKQRRNGFNSSTGYSKSSSASPLGPGRVPCTRLLRFVNISRWRGPEEVKRFLISSVRMSETLLQNLLLLLVGDARQRSPLFKRLCSSAKVQFLLQRRRCTGCRLR